MTEIYKKKLYEFYNNPNDRWYITKQKLDFYDSSYYATLAEKLFGNAKNNGIDASLKDYNYTSFNERFITNNKYFGLLDRTGDRVTDAGEKAFELSSKLHDFANNQVEKFRQPFILEPGAKKNNNNVNVFPVVALYKVLLLLREKNAKDPSINVKVSKDEFEVFVCLIKSFSECNDIVNSILEFRELNEADKDGILNEPTFKNKKSNSRISVFFNNLNKIWSDGDYFDLIPSRIEEVKSNVSVFEENLQKFESMTNEEYYDLLQSEKSLWDYVKVDRDNPSFNYESKKINGTNEIIYGAPGTGKSYMVNESIKYTPGDGLYDKFVFRTTFYEEYSYLDFVGEVKPDTFNDDIGYSFVPGIFTKSLKRAIDNPERKVYLIIEELTRGNAEAIFGDIFQLLDRDDNGKSVYGIDNANISKYVFDDEFCKVFIPSNLFIICTANSSDQNTFVLDTAFKRRFSFNYVDVKPSHNNNFKFIYGNKELNWDDFYMKLNDFIVYNLKLSEDKQIGEWFVVGSKDIKKNTQMVKEKVLNYLWEDVNGLSLINIDADNIFLDEFKTFRDVMVAFDEGKEVLNKKLMDSNNE
ncbi:hypothetical protein RZ75_12690 [Apilactobacillus kunkeei]|uniref:AlwI family type II restriction endonuclease n=1 Tax=Apilactobacillus kunkeei TaxID=148814 RepID=UPI0006B248AB|nr:AlwI family type II restriction endonuclease [Apilactobacillus kunkeei]KOY78300.1 hypothetical protein RZ75_12690 [Apilactobacillus kunkeei]